MTKIKAQLMPLSKMTEADVSNFKQWVWNLRHINMFQPKVMSAPRTIMCKASAVTEGGEEPLVYIPLQPVLMYDAIAAKPELDPKHEALALARIGQVVDETAKTLGFQEVFFICRDDRVSDLCAKHGFTEVSKVRVFKKTIEIGTQCESQRK